LPRSLECGQVKSGIGSRARSLCRRWSLQIYAICLLTICAHRVEEPARAGAVGTADESLHQRRDLVAQSRANSIVPKEPSRSTYTSVARFPALERTAF